MKGEHGIHGLCHEVLGVSPSGYYRWRQKRPSARRVEDAVLAEKIVAAHKGSRGNYGAPRIVKELQDQGTCTSKRRCARLMRQKGLRGRKKHRRGAAHDGQPSQPTSGRKPHRRDRPAPTGPNQSWIVLILPARQNLAEGWLFLAAILDVWSRRVVGWSCAATLHTSLVLAALRDALQRRRPPKGLLHHSDRGSQYVDADYLKVLTAAGVERSMSRAGNCYDNGAPRMRN